MWAEELPLPRHSEAGQCQPVPQCEFCGRCDFAGAYGLKIHQATNLVPFPVPALPAPFPAPPYPRAGTPFNTKPARFTRFILEGISFVHLFMADSCRAQLSEVASNHRCNQACAGPRSCCPLSAQAHLSAVTALWTFNTESE
jgi:hypothetical protein